MPAADSSPPKTESIVLGGGCFWCTDAAYKLLPGVKAVTCGYAGGKEPNPTYEQICAHATGHAEVIKIDFDPTQTSLAKVLDFFWQVHNPTQVDGQGNDHGTQYRSIIPLRERRAESGGREIAGDGAAGFPRPDCHGDRAADEILAGGGLPSGLFREKPAPRLLPGRDRAEDQEIESLAGRDKVMAWSSDLTSRRCSEPTQ